MKIRELKKKDAMLMLEWMHDFDVIKHMQGDFLKKTIEDCYIFIDDSNSSKDNIHMAIVDDNDEYMGTVSLKNVNYNTLSAEFAITVRKIAMGKGYSKYAMKEIIKYGFEVLKLKNIYWYVDKNNERAIKFYDKNQFNRVSYDEIKSNIGNIDNNNDNYLWYLA